MLAFGVRAVWVLYDAPRFAVYLRDGTMRSHGPKDEVDGGDVLPGFRMRVAQLVRP